MKIYLNPKKITRTLLATLITNYKFQVFQQYSSIKDDADFLLFALFFFYSDDADDDDQLSPGASPTQPGHNSAQYLERGHLPLLEELVTW